MSLQTSEKNISNNPYLVDEVNTFESISEKDSVVTDVIIVFDESGSMKIMGDEPVQSVNSFIEEQQKNCDDSATMTLVMFNIDHHRVIDRIPLKEIKPIDDGKYSPGGSTALNDAVCETIKYELQSNKPKNKVMLIITDGEENSSRNHSLIDRKNSIKNARDNYDWKIIFIGGNIDIDLEGESMGIDCDKCVSFNQLIPGDLMSLTRQTSINVSDFRRARTEGNNNVDLVINNLQKNLTCPVTKQEKNNIEMSLGQPYNNNLTRSYAQCCRSPLQSPRSNYQHSTDIPNTLSLPPLLSSINLYNNNKENI